MHTMKLRFHEQTKIRYNHVLHGVRANSKPLQRKFSRTREPFYKMEECENKNPEVKMQNDKFNLHEVMTFS